MDTAFNGFDIENRGLAPLTNHARIRMNGRGLTREAVRAALEFGREVHTRGAAIFAIGRREVEFYARQAVDLSPYEGVQVVCALDGGIMTVYRNRDFRKMRPYRRR